MRGISAFPEGLIQNVEELREGLLIWVASLKLVPIDSCEGQVLEEYNQNTDSKRVDVCLLKGIALLGDLRHLRGTVNVGACRVLNPGSHWFTVSEIDEGQSLMVLVSTGEHNVVWLDITVRYLIKSVQIKERLT